MSVWLVGVFVCFFCFFVYLVVLSHVFYTSSPILRSVCVFVCLFLCFCLIFRSVFTPVRLFLGSWVWSIWVFFFCSFVYLLVFSFVFYTSSPILGFLGVLGLCVCLFVCFCFYTCMRYFDHLGCYPRSFPCPFRCSCGPIQSAVSITWATTQFLDLVRSTYLPTNTEGPIDISSRNVRLSFGGTLKKFW